jgi:hypothetical protein
MVSVSSQGCAFDCEGLLSIMNGFASSRINFRFSASFSKISCSVRSVSDQELFYYATFFSFDIISTTNAAALITRAAAFCAAGPFVTVDLLSRQ